MKLGFLRKELGSEQRRARSFFFLSFSVRIVAVDFLKCCVAQGEDPRARNIEAGINDSI